VACDGSVIARAQAATIVGGGSEAAWAPVAGLIESLLDHDISVAGIGSAGPIDTRSGTISPLNIEDWRSFPIVDRVRDLTGLEPVLAGDAQCAALAELVLGSARNSRVGMLIVVSTGIGGGVFVDGRVHVGRSGNAGHIGHAVVGSSDRQCACGQLGCVEAIASGPSMTRRAVELGWQPPGAVDASAMMDAARLGDSRAQQAVDEGAEVLAQAILNEAAVLDLDIAVLGGGVMESHDVMLPALRRAMDRRRFLDFIDGPALVLATRGSDAGLVGAGLLAHDPDRMIQ